MSIFYASIIMLLMGVLGGIINFILPGNHNNDGSKIKNKQQCVLFGIGATFLIPLFLEISQSKLMDNMFFGFSNNNEQSKTDSSKKESISDTAYIRVYFSDTAKKTGDTVFPNRPKPSAGVSKMALIAEDPNPAKSYLLFAAYCFLAAAAGFRFIDMLINKVVLQQELNKQKVENHELTKAITYHARTSEAKQGKEEEKVLGEIINEKTTNLVAGDEIKLPVINLPEVKYINDPQKGRFGGQPERNGRKLEAEVKAWADDSDWFKVTIRVKSTDSNNTLQGNVIFYLHNSFYESVRNVVVIDGVAEVNLTQVYGAFTVGAVADNGKTLLELDLSEIQSFPKKFRER